MGSNPLADMPRMDAILQAPALRALPVQREIIKAAARLELDASREQLRAGSAEPPTAEALAEQVAARLVRWLEPRPRPVINGTGVLLHTNLGRAPLAPVAVDAMAAAASSCDLEFELGTGLRGSRLDALGPLLRALLGAEDVMIVNNNAAGLLLSCTALGVPGGVVLSRGQMVEIGDSFRVATMAGAGGCPVWGIGSTNRTHVADYEAALTGTLPEMQGTKASALLWVHRSNFAQTGFVKELQLTELAKLARHHDVPLLADLGSGSLGRGMPPAEPTIQAYLTAGADLVLCSGDKLLGGPQAGVIAGRAELVQRCRQHPMARALRPDKATLAALHATVAIHAEDDRPALPLLHMLEVDVDTLRQRAQTIVAELDQKICSIRDSQATIGGGSLPGHTLPSVALGITTGDPERLAQRLRLGEPPVVGRIEHGAVLLDLRTIAPDADATLTAALQTALGLD